MLWKLVLVYVSYTVLFNTSILLLPLLMRFVCLLCSLGYTP